MKTVPTSEHPQRPIDSALHPIATGNYRIATPAIQAFYTLVGRCLRYRITGGLVYGPSRIGKTRAIEYLRLLLAETYPKITTYHAQASTSRGIPRGRSSRTFSRPPAIRIPMAAPTPPSASASPTRKIKEACSKSGSGVVILFCDEAQRYDENEYEWLRDVHDGLDRLQIKLFTFLVGQQDLVLSKKLSRSVRPRHDDRS